MRREEQEKEQSTTKVHPYVVAPNVGFGVGGSRTDQQNSVIMLW